MTKDTESLKQSITKKRKPKGKIREKDYVSTGSTMVNMGISGHPDRGFAKGKYYLIPGGSGSGKTWLTLNVLAEAAVNPEFDGYDFVHDIPEEGALMDIAHYFGKKCADRIQPPKGTKESPEYSSTVEEFYDKLAARFEAGKPFIYLLDSQDTLDAKDDLTKEKKLRRLRERAAKLGKEPPEEPGSYGTARAKLHSTKLRAVCNNLRKSGSILIIISQSRQAINAGPGDKDTRGGGNALTFYATIELWLKQAGHVKKRVRGKDRKIGTYMKVRVKKNRVSGKDRSVVVPILYDSGIDDVGSMIDWLLLEGGLKKGQGGKIKFPELGIEGTREELVEQIENDGRQQEVKMAVTALWADIENESKLTRKPRYQ